MRPHYAASWVPLVKEHNLAAKLECEAEAGIDIDPMHVEKSGEVVGHALALLGLMASGTRAIRCTPFVRCAGKIMECQHINGKEVFRAFDGTISLAEAKIRKGHPSGTAEEAISRRGFCQETPFQSNPGYSDVIAQPRRRSSAKSDGGMAGEGRW